MATTPGLIKPIFIKIERVHSHVIIISACSMSSPIILAPEKMLT